MIYLVYYKIYFFGESYHDTIGAYVPRYTGYISVYLGITRVIGFQMYFRGHWEDYYLQGFRTLRLQLGRAERARTLSPSRSGQRPARPGRPRAENYHYASSHQPAGCGKAQAGSDSAA